MVVENSHFRATFAGKIVGEKLESFLCDQIDVVAAMGTAALDAARLGLPTILLDAAYGRVTGDYRFKWLFETKHYSLGDVVNESHFEKGNDSLARIMAARSSLNMIQCQARATNTIVPITQWQRWLKNFASLLSRFNLNMGIFLCRF